MTLEPVSKQCHSYAGQLTKQLVLNGRCFNAIDDTWKRHFNICKLLKRYSIITQQSSSYHNKGEILGYNLQVSPTIYIYISFLSNITGLHQEAFGYYE